MKFSGLSSDGLIILTEKGKDLDDGNKCCSDTSLVEKLWDEKEHEDGTIDRGDGSKNHVDSNDLKIQRNTVQYVWEQKPRGQKAAKFINIKITVPPIDECWEMAQGKQNRTLEEKYL